MGLFTLFTRKGTASREEVAKEIISSIAKSAFDKFREVKFRQELGFEKLGEVEHDRIFNELVVTGMVLAYLTLEIGENLNPNEESRITFRNIKNNLVSSYVKYLQENGVEKDLADMWYQLVAMRCEEYRKDFAEHKQYFRNPRENHWVPIAAIGGLHHIRKGDTVPQDPLLPDLSRWCGILSVATQRIIADKALVIGKDGKSKNVHIADDGSVG